MNQECSAILEVNESELSDQSGMRSERRNWANPVNNSKLENSCIELSELENEKDSELWTPESSERNHMSLLILPKDEQNHNKHRRKLQFFFKVSGILDLFILPVLTGILFVLSDDSGNCDTLLRTWLEIYAVHYAFALVIQGVCFFMIISRMYKRKVVKYTIIALFVAWIVFWVVWIVVGSVIYTQGNTCSAEWALGHSASLGLLVLNYFEIALAVYLVSYYIN